jgi:nitrilase
LRDCHRGAARSPAGQAPLKKSLAPFLSHRRHRAIGERAIDLDKKRPLQSVNTSGVVQINEPDAIGEAARKAGVVVSIGVNERDGGSLYNTQLLFDADGALIQRRRKITPTHYERMIWGQGDGSGLCAVDSKVGRVGQLACFEHS